MIEVYLPENTNFEMNGDMTLLPTKCDAESELGGKWFLDISHPIDSDNRWKYIIKEAVLSVPTFMGRKQLYRIDKITDKSDTQISAKAYPIFFDSSDDHFIMDSRPTDKNGQETLDILMKGSKYSGQSDIIRSKTTYFIRRNLMNALGGDSPSFIEIWGGEPLFNNFKVIINERAGRDNGVEIRYGKNIKGVSVNEDMSEVVTRIVPVAYNGYTHSKSFIDSPLISNYAKKYIREIKFEDVKMRADIQDGDVENGIIVCNTQEELDQALEIKCQEQFGFGIDLFNVSIEVDMIDLSGTEEYKDFKDLEKITLGDDVHCYHLRLGINTIARVIKIVWDCINDKVKSVQLGDYQFDYFDEVDDAISKVEDVINKNGYVKAESVQGILDGIKTMMRAQATAAQPAAVRATIFEDLNPVSPTYGALCLGTMGFQIAYTRTADGSEWDWRTFGTGKGFFADCITAGTMLCDRIRGGTLKLGGLDNVDGLLQMLNASGVEIGRWDKDGITISKGTIRSADYVKGKSGMEINLDTATMTSYKTEIVDGEERRSMCVLSNGVLNFSNVNDETEYIQIRFTKTDSDGYVPEISMSADGKSFNITSASLRFLVGSIIQASMGIDANGTGYVNTKRLLLDGPIETGGQESQTLRIALPGGGYLQFINGIFVKGEAGTYGLSGTAEFSDGSYMHFTDGMLDGGSTTEGGDIG